MAQEVGCGRSVAHDLVVEGRVSVDGVVDVRPTRKVAEDAVVTVDGEAAGPVGVSADAAVEFGVVHEDEALIVVDKPAGLVVHPGSGEASGTLVHGLLARHPEIAGVGPDPQRPGIVHRLDRGTSGLLLVARTADAHAALAAAIAAREVERTYTALVLGRVDEATGRIEAPIGRAPSRPTLRAVVPDGRSAATDYEVDARFTEPEPTSLLTCHLETGRTHQIRVHLSAIDHPVVGDAPYGGGTAAIALDRPFLHARRLAFTHPLTGERLAFNSPLPTDLETVLAGLA